MTKQIITLSDNAAQRIKEIMANAKEPSIGVRIGVKSGGCAGMSYVMEYAKSSNSNDEVIEDKGIKVLIDPNAVMYLLGTEMDYKKEELSSTFVFKNPNETERWVRNNAFSLAFSINLLECSTKCFLSRIMRHYTQLYIVQQLSVKF